MLMFLPPKCSLSSKAWNEEGEKNQFIKQFLLAFCFKTGLKNYSGSMWAPRIHSNHRAQEPELV